MLHEKISNWCLLGKGLIEIILSYRIQPDRTKWFNVLILKDKINAFFLRHCTECSDAGIMLGYICKLAMGHITFIKLGKISIRLPDKAFTFPNFFDCFFKTFSDRRVGE